MSDEKIEPDQVVASVPESPDSSAPAGKAARRSGWQSAKDAIDYLSNAPATRKLTNTNAGPKVAFSR